MNIEKSIQSAFEYYKTGNLQQAENICKKILKVKPSEISLLLLLGIIYQELGHYESAIKYISKTVQLDPNNAKAHYSLGAVFQEKGEIDEAIACYQKALQINPQFDNVYYNLGIALKEKGEIDEAITCYQKALQINPNLADVYNNLGLLLQDKKQFNEAIDCYQNALKINPDYVYAYYNLANTFLEIRRFDEAITCYQNILKIKPDFADVYNHLGNALKGKRQLDEGIACYQKALQINPQFDNAYYNLGIALKEKGEIDEAIACYQKALQINPKHIDSYNNLGIVLQEKGQHDKAIVCYQKVLEINPNDSDAYNNLATAFQDKNQLEDAIAYYRKAIERNPNNADVYANMGLALDRKGMLTEAIESYYHALTFNPDNVEAYVNLGNVYKDQGNLDRAEECYRKALRIKPDCVLCYSNLLFPMNYNYRHNAQTIASEHLRFRKQIIEPLSFVRTFFTNERDPYRKLKIGYVSPDFRKHAVSYFFQPAIIEHNREHFEIFCYSNNPKHDEVTQRIQTNVDQWRYIVGISDQEVAELIREDKIDILVDLAGHTADNRILVFARKPAPIQISWIGYLATTGLSTMDYKISDNYADPFGETEQFYSEKLLRLPQSFLCYLPDKDSPEVGPLPALSTGHITFGSFNNFAKVTSEVFALWTKILKELPYSRLILKGKSFFDKTTCQYATNMFTKGGIDAERIILQPPDQSPKHLESYNLVDIGLDTFPFNGATTTCEALWMGVPVITIAGTVPIIHVWV